jgi:O-antigen ligase
VLWRASSKFEARWILAMFISALAIGFGWSRGATLAAIVGLVVFVVASAGQRRRAAVLAAIAIGMLAIGTAFSDPGDGSSAARTFSAVDSGRTPLYRAAVRGVQHRPVFGLGAGGVLTALQRTPPNEVLRWVGMPATAAIRSARSTPRLLVIDYTVADGTRQQYLNITTKVHNELLDYAVSYGLPAALLAAAMFLTALWRSRTNPALVASLAAFAAGLMTWPQVMRTAPILWAFLGLALASPQRHRNAS